ncbi:hypothetical protein [Nostoc sp. CHAB 5715]|nr:hypothetical protein [Nostoc sp. CHAB 5715]MCC5626340.1 hypothetical protein [Nostoc sp. CHAB 5715]
MTFYAASECHLSVVLYHLSMPNAPCPMPNAQCPITFYAASEKYITFPP